MSNPPAPAVYTVAHIAVTITDVTTLAQGMSPLLFKSCTPPSWSVQAPKESFHSDKGAVQQLITAVQNPTWGQMTLTQGWDTGFVFAKWMATVQDPASSIDKKQKDVKVDFLPADFATTNKPLYSWHTTTGLLVSLQTGGSDPTSHAPLITTVSIEANEWELFDDGGNKIGPL
jgi:hypothetical protein